MTTTDTVTEPETLSDDEWAAMFAGARAYIPVAAMASLAGQQADQSAETFRAEFDLLEKDVDNTLTASNKAVHDRFDAYQGIRQDAAPLPVRDPGASLAALPVLPVAEVLPERDPFTLPVAEVPRTAPDALAGFTPLAGSEEAAAKAAARANESLAAWGAPVDPEPAETAVLDLDAGGE